MTTTLAEVTVVGTWTEDFSDWGQCFNLLNYSSNQAFAFALEYLYTDSVFWDFNAELETVTTDECRRLMLQASSMYDNTLGGRDAASILRGYNYSSGDTPYAQPSGHIDTSHWSVLKVAAHWLFGGGAPLSVEIKDVHLDLNADRIGATSTTLNTFASQNTYPGVYHYDSGAYGYETYDDGHLGPKLILGGISLQTVGDFTRNSDGSWYFDGVTTAFPDYFNMDQRPGRPFWADVVVDIFHTIGGNDFVININGQHETKLGGN